MILYQSYEKLWEIKTISEFTEAKTAKDIAMYIKKVISSKIENQEKEKDEKNGRVKGDWDKKYEEHYKKSKNQKVKAYFSDDKIILLGGKKYTKKTLAFEFSYSVLPGNNYDVKAKQTIYWVKAGFTPEETKELREYFNKDSSFAKRFAFNNSEKNAVSQARELVDKLTEKGFANVHDICVYLKRLKSGNTLQAMSVKELINYILQKKYEKIANEGKEIDTQATDSEGFELKAKGNDFISKAKSLIEQAKKNLKFYNIERKDKVFIKEIGDLVNKYNSSLASAMEWAEETTKDDTILKNIESNLADNDSNDLENEKNLYIYFEKLQSKYAKLTGDRKKVISALLKKKCRDKFIIFKSNKYYSRN